VINVINPIAMRMKFILSLLISNLIFFYCFSQPGKSTIIIGGDLGLDYEKSSDDYSEKDKRTDFSFKVTPAVGFFISKNVAIGLNVGLEYNKFDYYENIVVNDNNYTYVLQVEVNKKTTVYITKPFLSIYHFFNDKLGIKNNFSGGVGFGTSANIRGGTNIYGDNKISEVLANYELKILLVPTKRMAICIGIVGVDYLHKSEKEYIVTTKTDHIQFYSPLNNALSVGLEFYLGGEAAEKK
jgi:hypothetical protein